MQDCFLTTRDGSTVLTHPFILPITHLFGPLITHPCCLQLEKDMQDCFLMTRDGSTIACGMLKKYSDTHAEVIRPTSLSTTYPFFTLPNPAPNLSLFLTKPNISLLHLSPTPLPLVLYLFHLCRFVVWRSIHQLTYVSQLSNFINSLPSFLLSHLSSTCVGLLSGGPSILSKGRTGRDVIGLSR